MYHLSLRLLRTSSCATRCRKQRCGAVANSDLSWWRSACKISQAPPPRVLSAVVLVLTTGAYTAHPVHSQTVVGQTDAYLCHGALSNN